MIDIEVGRARMYFSVENKVKMGARRLGYKIQFLGPKYNLYRIVILSSSIEWPM